jgi:hypothetical protein
MTSLIAVINPFGTGDAAVVFWGRGSAVASKNRRRE